MGLPASGASDRCLVVDVENAQSPCLKEFNRKLHQCVVFDEMEGAAFILRNKKLMQAHVEGAVVVHFASRSGSVGVRAPVGCRIGQNLVEGWTKRMRVVAGWPGPHGSASPL